MNHLTKRGSIFMPTILQCRSRYNSRNPKPKILPRRVFEVVTAPILPETLEKPPVNCSYLMKKKDIREVKIQENLYEQFLIRRCTEMFQENKMIIVFATTPTRFREQCDLERTLKKQGFKYQLWPNAIVKQTITDTKWQNLEPLLLSRNCYVTSQESKLPALIKVIKKIPQLFMLGGFVEDRLLSKEGLVQAASLPPLDIMLAETVSILNSSASKTHSLLESHQQELSRNLGQYIKDQTPQES